MRVSKYVHEETKALIYKHAIWRMNWNGLSSCHTATPPPLGTGPPIQNFEFRHQLPDYPIMLERAMDLIVSTGFLPSNPHLDKRASSTIEFHFGRDFPPMLWLGRKYLGPDDFRELEKLRCFRQLVVRLVRAPNCRSASWNNDYVRDSLARIKIRLERSLEPAAYEGERTNLQLKFWPSKFEVKECEGVNEVWAYPKRLI